VENLLQDPETAWLVKDKSTTFNILAIEDRRVVVYPCRNSELMNFAGIFPDQNSQGSEEEWNVSAPLDGLLEAFRMFHPSILAVLKHAQDLDDLKLWKLLYRAPLPTWVKGKTCILGDAAHPMLPHQGQGGGQSIEDGGALGILLSNITSVSEIPERLKLFEKVRWNRASAVQVMSNAGQDQAEKIRAEAERYINGPVPCKYLPYLEISIIIS
jgi:salicylate hydroxylase